jgi:hypothetical protein
MTNQQIAGLIKIMTTVISAQAEKVKKHAKESESKEESDRFFNSQKAACRPNRKLTTIPYPKGYELRNPYEW